MKKFFALLLTTVMCLLAVSAGAEPAKMAGTMEFSLTDAAISVGDSQYDLGFDVHFAAQVEDGALLAEVCLTDDEGKAYFPGRVKVDREGLIAAFDGTSSAAKVSFADLMTRSEAEADAVDPALMETLEQMLMSYADLFAAAAEMDPFAQPAANADMGKYIDRGEPVHISRSEEEDGPITGEYAYTLTKDDLADLFAAALAEENNPTGPALVKYLNAYLSMLGVDLPEGGAVQYLREAPVEFTAECTETLVWYEENGEALPAQEGKIGMDMRASSGGVEIAANVALIYDETDMYCLLTVPDLEGASISMTLNTIQEEAGQRTTVSLYAAMPEAVDTTADVAAAIPDDADVGFGVKTDMFGDAVEVEEVAFADSEEASVSVIGGTEGPAAVFTAEETETIDAADAPSDVVVSGDEEGSVGIIGGADGPTAVFVTSPLGELDSLSMYMETFVGTPDADGVSDYQMAYNYVVGELATVQVATEGTVARKDGEIAEVLAVDAMIEMEELQLGFSGNIAAAIGGEVEIAAPAGEAVDIMNGDEMQIGALEAEAEQILQEGADMIMSGGLANAVMELAMASYDSYDENYEEYESEIEEFSSIEELEASVGYDLPLQEKIDDLEFASASDCGGTATVTYTLPSDETYKALTIYLYDQEVNKAYLLDKDGGYEQLGGTEDALLVQLNGFDGEIGYCGLTWEIIPGVQAEGYLYSDERFDVDYVMELIRAIQYGE